MKSLIYETLVESEKNLLARVITAANVEQFRYWLSSESVFLSDKCEMCLKVVGGNNYIFMSFTCEK